MSRREPWNAPAESDRLQCWRLGRAMKPACVRHSSGRIVTSRQLQQVPGTDPEQREGEASGSEGEGRWI